MQEFGGSVYDFHLGWCAAHRELSGNKVTGNRRFDLFLPNFTKLAKYPAPVRLLAFLVTLALFWLPIAIPIYWLGNDPNLVTILTMGLLFGGFLLLTPWWGKQLYQQPRLLQSYGLVRTRQNGIDLFKGLVTGLLMTLSLFALQGLLGWLEFQTPSLALWQLIGEGLASALGIGLAEELVFRGWLLEELQRDYSPRLSLWTSAIIFALLHFTKPLPEMIRMLPAFPALLLLGLTLVWAKWSTRGRLGLSIGLHAGLVWGYYIINVGQLVQYSGQVSPWITGVDGNPLAGGMGLLFMGFLAYYMKN
ncbi:MAG: CPBP family intramembrane metalloprotease [Symploca sp. SIO1B1]|nr:CPBP family intramembrane metalloprotease [Symploca sp. SIO1A3]NER97670.1 CPBP family intramembrane metalloprotease [Symploca sp. SIO1B1]